MNLEKYTEVFENEKSTVKDTIQSLNELKKLKKTIVTLLASTNKEKKHKITMNNIDTHLTKLTEIMGNINMDDLESIKELISLKSVIEQCKDFLENNRPNVYKSENGVDIDITHKIKNKLVIKKIDAASTEESDSGEDEDGSEETEEINDLDDDLESSDED